jgi:glucose-1-phosphate thymidylyltransferase
VLVKAVIVVGRCPLGRSAGRGACAIPALEAVANRPIIHHVIDELRAAPPVELIIAGDADALLAVRDSFVGEERETPPIDYVIMDPCFDIAATLRSVAPLVGDSPCVLQPGDGLLGEPVGSLVDSLAQGSPDLVLHVADLTESAGYTDPGAIAAARNGPWRRASSDPEVAVFGAGAVQQAVGIAEACERANLSLIAERMTAAGGSVRFQLIESWRRYSGDGSDLLELNRLALDGLTPEVRPSLRRENRIEGRVFIHPTASAQASVIIGPTVIGPGARVENAYIGAYTSVGAGARIEGAEIERSIISPGASVVHVGGRLVSSLVGRNARVFRDFSLPRAMRLWVGDGGEVALC